MNWLLATRNAGKLRENRAACALPGVEWVGLDAYPAIPEAPEPGATFGENARAKALYYAQRSGLVALADDSGLEVDALAGAPGVHSAHFAGEPRSDDANNRRLIAELRSRPTASRTARFVCCMALAFHERILLESRGVLCGQIIDEPRGLNGFGYDPHFLTADSGLTLAELPTDAKNRISHRGQALRALLVELPRVLAEIGG